MRRIGGSTQCLWYVPLSVTARIGNVFFSSAEHFDILNGSNDIRPVLGLERQLLLASKLVLINQNKYNIHMERILAPPILIITRVIV